MFAQVKIFSWLSQKPNNTIKQEKLFIERERERERGYLHGEEERVAREEIRVWEVRRERVMKSFGSA